MLAPAEKETLAPRSICGQRLMPNRKLHLLYTNYLYAVGPPAVAPAALPLEPGLLPDRLVACRQPCA
jgi:hypothetical protein